VPQIKKEAEKQGLAQDRIRFGTTLPKKVFFFILVTGPRRSLDLKLSDTRVYEPPQRSVAIAGSRCTSLIRNSGRLGPYSRTMLMALWQSWGGGQFLMSEVPL